MFQSIMTYRKQMLFAVLTLCFIKADARAAIHPEISDASLPVKNYGFRRFCSCFDGSKRKNKIDQTSKDKYNMAGMPRPEISSGDHPHEQSTNVVKPVRINLIF